MPGYELVVAEFDSTKFAAALKDAEYYIGSPQFRLGADYRARTSSRCMSRSTPRDTSIDRGTRARADETFSDPDQHLPGSGGRCGRAL